MCYHTRPRGGTIAKIIGKLLAELCHQLRGFTKQTTTVKRVSVNVLWLPVFTFRLPLGLIFGVRVKLSLAHTFGARDKLSLAHTFVVKERVAPDNSTFAAVEVPNFNIGQ